MELNKDFLFNLIFFALVVGGDKTTFTHSHTLKPLICILLLSHKTYISNSLKALHFFNTHVRKHENLVINTTHTHTFTHTHTYLYTVTVCIFFTSLLRLFFFFALFCSFSKSRIRHLNGFPLLQSS